MKKYLWIFIFLILIAGIAIYYFNNKNGNNAEVYTAERTSIQTKSEDANLDLNVINNNSTYNSDENNEEEISEFSTELPKDTKARYSNIDLACQVLNGTVIKAGETFSLWNVLGSPNKEKGYQKAKTFTSDGKVTKGYGGGICQISTTIYNAVLEIEGIEIVERHEHSRDVVYIEDGKDAAVSYKSADLKFKNTLGYDVRMEATLEDNQVKIKLVRI